MMQLNSQFQTTHTQGVSVESIIGNSDVMNFVLMAEIEKELLDNPYDMISLVFLLYDVPDTALQRLIEFQRGSNDATTSTNLNMLHEWFRHAKHNPNWKQEFVEALLICQLHSIVKKLGINVPATRRYYQTDSITVKMYVNPMKKALYKLCEGINSEELLQLKKALLKFNIDTTEYDSCELVFLKLMSDKFITISQYKYNKKVLGFKMDVDKLIKVIVENLPGLRKLVLEIDMLQETMNETSKTGIKITPSAPSEHEIVDETRDKQELMNGLSKSGITVIKGGPSEHKTKPRKESMNDVSKSGTTLTASPSTEHAIVVETKQGKESLNDVSKSNIMSTASAPSEQEILDETRQRQDSKNGASKPGIMVAVSVSAPSEHKIVDETMQEQPGKIYPEDLADEMADICDLSLDHFLEDLESDAGVNKILLKV